MRRMVPAVAAALVLSPGQASAVRLEPHAASGMELAPGMEPIRRHREVRWNGAPPPGRERAWARFFAHAGRGWDVLWDLGTGVPSRIFGPGLPAPGVVESAAAAAAHARAFLAAHLDLLAPGAHPSELELSTNDLQAGLRTVGFLQRKAGLPVEGGQLSLRYRADRLIVIASEALPDVEALAPTLAPDAAVAAARAWIEETDAPVAVTVDAVEAVVLPLVGTRSTFRTAYRVELRTQEPINRWAVHVDAVQGTRLARASLLRFGTAQLSFDVPLRAPQLGRAPLPAASAFVHAGGVKLTSGDDGSVVYAEPDPASLELRPVGKFVVVDAVLGNDLVATLQATDGAALVLGSPDVEFDDAQLSAYVHTMTAKTWARGVAPSMAWLNGSLSVRVNQEKGANCNAFWDGVTTNFLVQNSYCNNTARLADVVYHEFAHGFHQHSILPGVGAHGDGSLGEGAADYVAATITGDPVLAPGFFLAGEPLRYLEPDRVWPDDLHWDPHQTGLIFAGAMWDLRKELVQTRGEAEGVALADGFLFQALRRAVDIPSTYAEILAADDDDGDLANGTPNLCAIQRAFVPHGLGPGVDAAGVELRHEPVTHAGEGEEIPVSATLTARHPSCQGANDFDVALTWRRLVPPGSPKSVALKLGDDAFSGAIPPAAAGSSLGYRLEVTAGPSRRALPDNPVDPYYQIFVGEVLPIYCTDFEQEEEGWVHDALPGSPLSGADEWQRGPPSGLGGDPPAAFSGSNVWGTDLDGDQLYTSSRGSYLESPPIDLGGRKRVRLQYRRWLHVEDARGDRAWIEVNGVVVWQNHETHENETALHHRDQEWRFHDIDISKQAASGVVQVRFALEADPLLRLGGWNLDDFCLVTWPAERVLAPPGATLPPPAPPREDSASCACRATGGRAPDMSPLLLATALVATWRRRRVVGAEGAGSPPPRRRKGSIPRAVRRTKRA